MSFPVDTPPNQTTLSAILDTGYAALNAADEEQAEQLFRRAVQLDPRSAAAWRALAATQIGARHGMCLRWAEYAEAYHAAAGAARPARPAHQTTRPRSRPARRALLQAGAALAAAALVLAVGSDIAYRERFLPGVHVGTLDVGNLRYNDGARLIAARRKALDERTIVLRAGEHTLSVPLSTALAQPEPKPAAAAFRFGHEAAFGTRALARLRAVAGYSYAVDDTSAAPAAVNAIVEKLAARSNQGRREAQLVHTAASWEVVPEQIGLALLRDQAAAQLAALVDAADAQAPTAELTVALTTAAPTRTAAELAPIGQRLNALAAQPLTVRSGEHSWTLDRSVLMDVDTARSADTLAPSASLIAQQVEQLAREVAVAPVPSQLAREGTRVRSMTMGQPGKELDQAVAAQKIADALRTGAAEVELPVAELAPPPGEVEQLGLIAELGRGESQFLTYSSPERDANVETGGREIDGVLVAPGEVFSFTQTIGDITWEEGYRWGEAIEAGTIVPSLGGGICQVSTTMFRAAFWSGLEIVERHHHSWRLPWYEVDAPPGMDATIALGGPDLKVRNNTAHYLLIRAETDLATKRQTVVIYGTPDGRKVQMQPLAGGNIGVERYVIGGNGAVADEAYISYYTQ